MLNVNSLMIAYPFSYQETVKQVRKFPPNLHQLSQNSHNGHMFWWSRQHLYGNSKTQDVDNVSEDESQDEDLIKQLICKTACLKQYIEDRDSEPREAIHDLEQRLNRLTLTMHHLDTPIGNVLDRYTETLMHHNKENISGEFFTTRYTHIKWARLFTT